LAEQSLRKSDRSPAPRLRYLDEHDGPPVSQRDPHVVARLAESHAFLVERMTERVAARWPEAVDADWVRSHAMVALRRAAAEVEEEEDLPLEAVRAIQQRMRTLLGGTEWYRGAMLGRARPLCEAWRGAVLAGREPSDRTLCTRLRLSADELRERFVELATVFAVEPAGLLPGGVELSEGVAAALGGMPAEQQLVVSLYFERQLTIAEIAGVMGMLPVRAQELFGRAAAAIAGEAALSEWPPTVAVMG
jgi:RNA polymerase sigma factor for flagellar operon FliA